MTNTQLKKHEKEIDSYVNKTIKWVLKTIKTNKDVTVKNEFYKDAESFYLLYKLENVFKFELCVHPEIFNTYNEIEDGLIGGINLYLKDNTKIRFDFKFNKQKEVTHVYLYEDFIKSYVEVKNDKLNKFVKNSLIMLMDNFKKKRQERSIRSLQTLKEFSKTNIS